MKYNSIDAWLADRPAAYNFVEDTQEGNTGTVPDYGAVENEYEKYFIYRAELYNKGHNELLADTAVDKVNAFRKNAGRYATKDPDTDSGLLQKIYKRLWHDFVDRPFMKDFDGKIASDTMTSAQTTFNKAMGKLINAPVIQSVYKEEQKNGSTNSSIAAAANHTDGAFYSLMDANYPHMTAFLSRYHTIGNYCPVPAGFNAPRSGYCARYDYWDLTLMKIRKWYLSADKMPLDERDALIQKELLHNHKNANALYCERWLENFGSGETGWRHFVNTLFMQDYVYTEPDRYYEVKPFWEGHSWNKPGMPDGIQEIDDCLKEMTDRIERRADRVIDACNGKNN